MLSVLVALAFARPSLTASFASVNISPPELLPLGGYTERHGKVMDSGGDPLYARCLLLRSGGVEYAIVSVETLTIPESLLRDVKSRIKPDTHLLLCATHTHCAPDSQMLNDRMTFAIPGVATYKRRWLKWYADKIASVVTKAESAKPFPVTSIQAQVWQSDVNRGRRKGAAPDKTATLLEAGHRPLFFEYAAHGTFNDADENRTRGDWPGQVSRLAPLALIGPIGDVSPKAPGLDHAPAPKKIDAFWGRIRHDRAKAVTHRDWRLGAAIAWANVDIPLGKPVPHPSFEPKSLGNLFVSRFAPPTASVSAIRIGKLAIVGIPGEPTSILGRQIVAAGHAMGFSDVLVLSHCNGWMGYILGPTDYDAGGYEATLSFYGRLEGNQVVNSAKKALAQLMPGQKPSRVHRP